MADSAEARHIFLSYAREDQAQVKAVATALANEGWRVWWDRDNLPPGKPFRGTDTTSFGWCIRPPNRADLRHADHQSLIENHAKTSILMECA